MPWNNELAWILGSVALALGLAVGVLFWNRQGRAQLPVPAELSSSRVDSSRTSELIWRESQPMWLLLFLMPLTLGVVIGVSLLQQGSKPLPAAILPLIGLLMLLPLPLLARMVTEVRGDSLRWSFGWLGWPRWRIDLDEIIAIESAGSRWSEGLGIRFTREGMLYNASGSKAVRLSLRSGRRLRLGTQDPQRLIQALQPRIATAAR